jgi:hypothetical protein
VEKANPSGDLLRYTHLQSLRRTGKVRLVFSGSQALQLNLNN